MPPESAEPGVPTPSGKGTFAADPAVGRDLATVDWSATSLGDPVSWPQSLRTAVDILLSSRFPMWMAWGPQLTFFCNAAYRRDTLGRKYPWALGRPASEVWAEIWHDIGPRIDTVMTTGEATWDESLLLFLERSGYPEETYHTFSYSPLRDDRGTVVGMLCVVSEDTERVIGERRMATLRDLGSDPSVVRTEQEMLAFAARQLDRNQYDLPFTLTYLLDDEDQARLATSTGIPEGHPAAPLTLPTDVSDTVWPAAALARGESVVVRLDASRGAGLPTGSWPEPPTQALVVPLVQQGGVPYGFLVAGLNRYRPLDDAYHDFVGLASGHVAAGIGSARSYQAQQRRAEELVELDRAKTAFFSNVSHEFRTPLTLIMGPLDELRSRLPESDVRSHEELEIIHRNGLRLGKLVNTLLDFSRIEAGRMRATYEPVDLAAGTAELASVFRSAVDKAGLVLEVDCPPLPEPVHLDREMWEKVILNLLSNALKFTFDGSIRVAVHAEGSEAVVTVADTGIGVADQEMPRLFERFHRIENVRSRSNEGSGIGLALVRELVQLHGGTITADSATGHGTTFSIRLPFGTAHLPGDSIAPATGTTAVSATADPYLHEALRWLPGDRATGDPTGSGVGTGAGVPAARSATSARVLVAEDNTDMREYLVRLLGSAGYRVDSVPDGQAALDAVRTDAPDLLVSDVMMPRLDGLALIGALRADQRTAGVPVLLLSARAGQEASIEGLEAGADDYLVKPFAAAELLARIRANIELARLRNHHARWRAALVDSLQEAFFVCDEQGSVIETNAAFADILGFGTEGLPYTYPHPWLPTAQADPRAHEQASRAFQELLTARSGSYILPVVHRDGHRLWVSATFNQVQDPDTGRRAAVGTFRDVSAERYALRRETAMAALSTRLAEATNLSEALSAALTELRTLWQVQSVVAAVFGGSGDVQLTATDPGLTWSDLPPEHRAILTGLYRQPLLTPSVHHGDGGAIVLEHPEGPLVVWVGPGETRPFTDQDQVLLSLLAGRIAQGLTRAHQIDQQRETAITLQRAILGPARLPAGFAVRYEPAARPLEVGGDWYDTVQLPDRRIGIVVGDCVGRGLEAATVMGQLRSACRALLLQDTGPAQTLMALDRFAAGIPGALCTTVFCGVLDPETGDLVYSSAGHPPGILAHPDGTTRLLEDGRSFPLAVRTGAPRPEARQTMPPRSTLMLYTDGLVERRRRSLREGIDQASSVVQDGRGAPVDELASSVMTVLAPEGGYDDDVALLLYRHPAPLDVSFPADSSQLAPVRRALRSWLNQCGLPAQTVQNVLVAAGEACANAIEHGHRHAAGARIRLHASATVSDLTLTIADSGQWKAPQPEVNVQRGRGVTLMRALMQQVTITPGDTGTTVDMHTRIA